MKRLDLPKSVCIVVRNTAGQVVLVQRKNDPRRWCLPGGKVDPTDLTPTDAALRELSEETGLYWAGPYDLLPFAVDPDSGFLCHVFVLRFPLPSRATLHPGPGEPPARWADWREALDPAVNPFAGHLLSIGLREVFEDVDGGPASP